MKRLAFAAGILAVSLATSIPARADFAVVRMQDGWCQVWWNSRDTPWGDQWTKVAIGLPDWVTASEALDNARSEGVCQ
jgi:hypothetical protein